MTLPLRSSTHPSLIPPISSSKHISRQLLVRSNVSATHCQSSSTRLSPGNSEQLALPSFQNLWQSIQGPAEPPCSLDLAIPLGNARQLEDVASMQQTVVARPTLLLDTHLPSLSPYAATATQLSEEISPSGRQSTAPSESSDAYSDLSNFDTLSDDFRRNNEAALNHVVEREDPSTRDLWESYVQRVGAKDKGNDLVMCVHAKKQKKGKAKAENTDQPPNETCGYVALKQTVKRHINSTHLGISPFVCTFCGSRFSQRQAAVIHVNGSHLGIKNLECEYCPERFSDPSRKNKHVSKAHEDVMSQVRSRRKNPYAHVSRRR